MKSSVLQRSPSRRLVPPAPVTADRGPAPSSIPLPAAFATPQGNVSQPSASAPSFQGLSQELLGQSGNQTSRVTPQSGGQALPDSLRSPLEALSGFDLADVRIHASQSAAQVGAQALTTGNQMAVAPGRLDLQSRKSR